MTFQWIGQAVPRRDALGKTTGELKFMSDLSFPDMLWGGILRSQHPHAEIKHINCTAALAIPGVVTVLTHKDVPGLNGYGIAVQDQPVLCGDKVRYMGDAVAVVAAETKEIVEQALGAIEVDYEPLPLVTDPIEAAANRPAFVHTEGNVFRHTHVENGDVDAAFAEAAVVIENTYVTSRQMHGFLETEGGVANIDEEGNITVWCGSHYPHRDQLQIARSLAYPMEKIRVVSTAVGGGFGGKDEITIQIHLALLALKTGRPVKIHLSREESIVAGWKRHPMIIKLKTAAAKDGTLLANEVTIYSDTGAYASLGGSVLNVAIENSSGAYRVPNVRKNGYCVYTNNGVAGAMRGFGDNQVTFAMESQMDLIARELGMEPLEIRLKNGLRRGDQAALGHTMTQSVGTIKTLQAAGETFAWQEREQWKKDVSKPWIRRGVGIATALKGVGLGRGLPDMGRAVITLDQEGCFTVAVGCPDVGQGNTIAFTQIAAEVLCCDIAQVRTITGDTLLTPDSGTSTASRSIYAAGNAIIVAANLMLDALKNEAGQRSGLDTNKCTHEHEEDFEHAHQEEHEHQKEHKHHEEHENKHEMICQNGTVYSKKNPERAFTYRELAPALIEKQANCITGTFTMPIADKGIEGAPGLPHLVYSAITNVAMVEVNTMTGETQVVKVVSIPDAGRIINRQGLEGQSEGGVLMGMGYALSEDVVMKEGKVLTTNLSTYIMHTSLDAPETETLPVEELEESGPFGAKGIGEAISIAVTPAITNAIMDATGIAMISLPITPEKLLEALEKTIK